MPMRHDFPHALFLCLPTRQQLTANSANGHFHSDNCSIPNVFANLRPAVLTFISSLRFYRRFPVKFQAMSMYRDIQEHHLERVLKML